MPRSTRHIEPLLVTTALNEDVGTVVVTFTPSAIEVYSNDVGTAVVTFTPSAIGTYGYIDSGTTTIKFTVSALTIHVDAATIYLDLDFGADDCHSILTPHWHLDIVKRWNITIVSNRWHIAVVENRWETWMIGVAVDNPCPIPTF
jgi:hypothetical protein